MPNIPQPLKLQSTQVPKSFKPRIALFPLLQGYRLYADLARSWRDNKRNCWGVRWRSRSSSLWETRSSQSAKQLWQSLPPVYRQCAICYTDFWEAYEQILPSKRHKAVGKDSGKTSYIERFNNTLRQRVGCLVCKTLSFSKILDNHIGAIWYFVHHYNANLRS